jgi:hypothetical protein
MSRILANFFITKNIFMDLYLIVLGTKKKQNLYKKKASN